MKIYIKPTALKLVRLTISKNRTDRKYITLQDTSAEEVHKELAGLIESQKLPTIQQGPYTRIEIREQMGGENGKYHCISFKGLSPKQTYDLIVKRVEQLQ